MPFDHTTDHNIQVPRYEAMNMPAPQVFDTQKIVDHGLAQINQIIDNFSPLAINDRRAKLAHAIYLKTAYEKANHGDMSMLRMMQDPNYKWRQQAMADAHEAHVINANAARKKSADQEEEDRKFRAHFQVGGAAPQDAPPREPDPANDPAAEWTDDEYNAAEQQDGASGGGGSMI